MSDIPESGEGGGGLPGWVMTFADLMTLLMCFFVLLLSFSEMDVAKFKQMAGSMERAFGVQTEIDAKGIPRGTSIIAQEFSPGTPERTVMNSVRQYTVNSNQSTLDVGQRRGDQQEDGKGKGPQQSAAQSEAQARRQSQGENPSLEEAERLAEEQAQRLREEFKSEIAEGTLLVRRESTDVIVQILEQDSFASGSSLLESDFAPKLQRMGAILKTMVGAITVAGHTDNVPISTSQFRSNWDLSVMRATTVAHQLLDAGVPPERLLASGHADTQPRALNDTPEHRALNRRIDITLITSKRQHGFTAEQLAASTTGQEAHTDSSGNAEASAPADSVSTQNDAR
jgi:chemotaxis protein MotB